MSESNSIRTERRFGVTAHLDPNALRRIHNVRQSDTWQDLLDVMEQCCIEIESVLINTDADDEKAVLANHKMSKAAWQMFTHFQQRIDAEINTYLSSVLSTPLSPPRSFAEMEREHLLNAILPEPRDADEPGPF